MSYSLKVLKDYPLGFWKLDESSGTSAVDLSGCSNNATYSGTRTSNILPLVVGSSYASKINSSYSITYNIVNDYFNSSKATKFAISSNSDEPFSLEAWFYPKIASTSLVPIIGDASADVGLFYDNGNILFSVQSEEVFYTVKNPERAIHVVGTYSGKSITLYIDGEKVITKSFSPFKFTNSTLSLKSGPCTSSDYFLINNVALYRYEVSSYSVADHYYAALGLNPADIVIKNKGEYFAIADRTPFVPFKYSYPGNKSWKYLIEDGLTYNSLENSLSIEKTSTSSSSSIDIKDFISIPVSVTADSSKIEWTGTKGVSVYISFDDITYVECSNGSVIPGYSLNSFSSNTGFYLKVTFSSSDTSKYLPKIYDLSISFYNDQIIYSNNGSSYFSTLEGVAGVVNFDAVVCAKNTPVLFRYKRNGIETFYNSAFHITANYGIRTIEFFYTPDNFSDDGGLISTSNGVSLESHYHWNNVGAITKTSISAIYVNGVNKYSETNINNVFSAGNMYHVVIVFPATVTGDIEFNHSQNGATAALYQNIALYQNAFAQSDVTENYNLYTLGSYLSVNEKSGNLSMQVVENSANYYNNDWLVYKTQ